MKAVGLGLIGLLLAASVSAQPIHGHPQKAFSANTQLGAFYGFTWNGSSWVQQ